MTKTNIELQVQQTARVDFDLTLGQAAQTVEVSASGALLTTENATVGTVIEEKRIVDLPLNGRNFFSPSTRLNCVAGVSPVIDNPTANRYLNPAAFANSIAGQYGNCGRNNLIGPKQVNIDFSAIKNFRITERQALQFRMEMFNAPNHVQWGNPNANWGNQNAAPAARSQFRADPLHDCQDAPDSTGFEI
jgi:hypothetical protein